MNLSRSLVLIALFASTAMGQMTLKNMGLKPEEARKCASQGDADCQARLGMFYENGSDGVLEDHAEAIMWYRKAADQGLVAAEMALASIYDHGYHVPQDYTEAAKCYRLAAERGDLDAQRNIAFLYLAGRGVPQDFVRAHMWANLNVAGLQSKAQDEVDAVKAGPGTEKDKEEVLQILQRYGDQRINAAVDTRNLIEGQMTPAQIAEAQRLAGEWKPTKAKLGK
jgi:TPR repeat protein